MKVLVISHMYPKEYNPNYGIFVHEQVLALKKSGHELLVVSPTLYVPPLLDQLSSKWKGYKKQPQRACLDGISVYYPRVFRLPGNLGLHLAGKVYYLQLSSFIRKLRKEFPFELIHAHVALPDGQLGMLLKKDLNLPLVTSIHGQDFQTTIYRNENCKKAVIEVLKSSDRVITVSEKLKRIGQELCEDAHKYATVHNGVNPEKVVGQEERLLPEKGKRMILSVGNLKKPKGHDLTVKAFGRIHDKYPDACLVIIGDGPEMDPLKQLIRDLKLQDKVMLLGRQPHGEVLRYMQACELFVLPSWQEGFGVVYVEAMAHGKPVIGCRGQGIADVIKDGENGILVEPKSLEDLAHKMSELLENPALGEKIGQRARDTVFEDLTWEKNAEKMDRIYRELVKK